MRALQNGFKWLAVLVDYPLLSRQASLFAAAPLHVTTLGDGARRRDRRGVGRPAGLTLWLLQPRLSPAASQSSTCCRSRCAARTASAACRAGELAHSGGLGGGTSTTDSRSSSHSDRMAGPLLFSTAHMFRQPAGHSSSLIEANLVMVLIMASVSVRCSASLSWSNYSHQFDELVAQRPRRVCRRDASMVYLSLAFSFERYIKVPPQQNVFPV